MIFSFRSKETEAIWRGDFVKSFPPDIQNLARRKLRMLNSARRLGDLRILERARNGQHCIGIHDQWRVGFHWTERGARDVGIVG